MGKKILYVICKIMNWLMFMVVFIVQDLIGYYYYGHESPYYLSAENVFTYFVWLGYMAFAFFWVTCHHTSSRWTYQSFYFAGYLIGLYKLFTDTEHNITIVYKATAVILTVIAFACKIYTMVRETETYRSQADWRESNSIREHNDRLDRELRAATYDLEYARNAAERQRAEARLERAKLNRERYRED